MSVTLKEIAQKSGCSVTTVSRVLRQQGDISEDTRARVMEAARSLKYRPNFLVRGIQTGKTITVGVIITLRSDYHSVILQGIHDRLISDEYVPIVLRNDLSDVASSSGRFETNQIHRLVDRRVDGIIMSPMEDEEDEAYLREIRNHSLPLVLVDREMPNVAGNYIGNDDYLGGKMAAQHLLKMGHRRIAHIAGPDTVTTGKLRKRGFLDELEKAGGSQCPVVTDETFAEGVGQATELLSATQRPTAIFAANDLLAAGAYKAALKMGLRIPEEISIIGFGNLPLGSMLFPELTTFEQHPYNIGYAAAELLLEMITEKRRNSEPVKMHIKPKLIERASIHKLV